MSCRCWDQCCCEEEEPQILELIAAVRAVLNASQPFISAWEFDSFNPGVDGEEMALRLRIAVEKVEEGR